MESKGRSSFWIIPIVHNAMRMASPLLEKTHEGYPAWIDEYARGSYQLFAGNVLEAFQPLDFYHFLLLWYDLFLSRVYDVVSEIARKGVHIEEYAEYLPTPSSVRALLVKIISSFPHLPWRNTLAFKEVVDFLVRSLMHLSPLDTFSSHVNFHVYYPRSLFEQIPFEPAREGDGKMVGTMVLALGHLVNGLYNDVVTDMGWDSYGPYHSLSGGTDGVVRDFPNMRPHELWPERNRWLPVQEVRIYGMYKKVHMEMKFVGCHMISSRSLSESLKAWAVEADGRFLDRRDVQELTREAFALSKNHYEHVRSLSLERVKEKAVLQECFQLHRLFSWAGVPWQPIPEMFERIRGKEILQGKFTHGKILSFEEYCREFGIEYLKRVYRQDTERQGKTETDPPVQARGAGVAAVGLS